MGPWASVWSCDSDRPSDLEPGVRRLPPVDHISIVPSDPLNIWYIDGIIDIWYMDIYHSIKLMVLSSWNHLYQLAVSSENAIKCHQNSVVLKLSNWVWHWRRVAKSNRASVPVRQGQMNGSFPSHVSRFVTCSILFSHLCLHQPRKNRLSLASVGQDRQQAKTEQE